MARRVNAEYGVSLLRQIWDIGRLSWGPGRIGPGDYYSYRLFDKCLSDAEKREFVGWKAEARLDALNERSWCGLGLDKVLAYAVLQSNQIRIAPTRAIYLPGRKRPLAGATPLDTQAGLSAWLREPANYPFFSKPAASGFGKGAVWATHYDATTDRLMLRDGSSLGVLAFVDAVHAYDHEKLGYLFQDPIETDAMLLPSLGPAVTSLRMMVLQDEHKGPLLHRAFWKLPTGGNMNDNYNGGQTGNLAAAVDMQTGQITRVINGVGLDVVEIDQHPDTGVALRTLAVPNWQQVIAFTFEAALTLPKLRFQQWDIALSKDGPLALEVNLFATGGCDLTQLLYRKGLMDSNMNAFLQRHRI